MDGLGIGYVVVLGVLPAVILGLVALAFAAAREFRRRAEALRAFAAEAGLQFFPDEPPDEDERYSYVNFYPLGRWKSVEQNVVRGSRGGIEWDLFDYSIEGRSLGRYGWSGVVAARVPGMSLPRVRLRPEGRVHKLLEAVGLRDVRTGSAAFDGRYRLSGGDDDAVRAAGTPPAGAGRC